MKRFNSRNSRLGLLLSLAVLGLAAAIIILPSLSKTQAGGRDDKSNPEAATKSEGLPNYDIRLDTKAVEKMAAFRSSMNRSASAVADIRDEFAHAEAQLQSKKPTLKVEYSRTMRAPEIVAPDVTEGREFLTAASAANRSDILKGFLRQNKGLVGAAAESDVDELKVVSDYTNPNGNLSFTELEQQVNGIPVFQGRVKAGFTKKGEMIRMINNLAPEISSASVSADFGDPANAVRAARSFINDSSETDLNRNINASSDLKVVFGPDESATTAEKVYFPTEPGVAVPAWRVLIWQPQHAYYVIVDAQTGTMLWRKNITEDQTQPATYNVYTNPNAMINVARSPFPMSPGQASPNGVQAPGIGRTLMTLVGNEAPYTFNNSGWITDGGNSTDGNNVQAGLDRESPNVGLPTDIDPNGVASGVNRVFDFPFNPGIPTNPAQNGGDAPIPAGQSPGVCQTQGTATTPTDYQKAITTQLFYIVNRYHDELYRLGFTEQAGNFQTDNFGRGGAGKDRISAQAQDCLGSNNANFGTPADGFRPVMQMYLWTSPSPDFDGSLDADVVV
ncbi:MAG TPA: M36 family metallopeptidase, partial [Pyrinomonadaceae bacterium]|nr:M36 family metallopeptidase [Pyrinomonadaceae bacterium]